MSSGNRGSLLNTLVMLLFPEKWAWLFHSPLLCLQDPNVIACEIMHNSPSRYNPCVSFFKMSRYRCSHIQSPPTSIYWGRTGIEQSNPFPFPTFDVFDGRTSTRTGIDEKVKGNVFCRAESWQHGGVSQGLRAAAQAPEASAGNSTQCPPPTQSHRSLHFSPCTTHHFAYLTFMTYCNWIQTEK